MRLSFPFLLLAALTAGSLASPAPALAADHDARLLMALAAYHEDPPAEVLDFLGEDLDDALEAVARDEDAMRLQRIRALSLLARGGSEAGVKLAVNAATDPTWPLRLRIAATRAMSNYQLDRPETLTLLRQATHDADAGVREVAVRGLTLLATPEAQGVLTELRGRERHVAVRVALRDALVKTQPEAALLREGKLTRTANARVESEVVR